MGSAGLAVPTLRMRNFGLQAMYGSTSHAYYMFQFSLSSTAYQSQLLPPAQMAFSTIHVSSITLLVRIGPCAFIICSFAKSVSWMAKTACCRHSCRAACCSCCKHHMDLAQGPPPTHPSSTPPPTPPAPPPSKSPLQHTHCLGPKSP